MDKGLDSDRDRTYIEPIKWCRYIVTTAYVTVALIILSTCDLVFCGTNYSCPFIRCLLWDYIALLRHRPVL